jgi:hypothetical protein
MQASTETGTHRLQPLQHHLDGEFVRGLAWSAHRLTLPHLRQVTNEHFGGSVNLFCAAYDTRHAGRQDGNTLLSGLVSLLRRALHLTSAWRLRIRLAFPQPSAVACGKENKRRISMAGS